MHFLNVPYEMSNIFLTCIVHLLKTGNILRTYLKKKNAWETQAQEGCLVIEYLTWICAVPVLSLGR